MEEAPLRRPPRHVSFDLDTPGGGGDPIHGSPVRIPPEAAYSFTGKPFEAEKEATVSKEQDTIRRAIAIAPEKFGYKSEEDVAREQMIAQIRAQQAAQQSGSYIKYVAYALGIGAALFLGYKGVQAVTGSGSKSSGKVKRSPNNSDEDEE